MRIRDVVALLTDKELEELVDYAQSYMLSECAVVPDLNKRLEELECRPRGKALVEGVVKLIEGDSSSNLKNTKGYRLLKRQIYCAYCGEDYSDGTYSSPCRCGSTTVEIESHIVLDKGCSFRDCKFDVSDNLKSVE